MPTAKQRVNVPFDDTTFKALDEISKVEGTSKSRLVYKLVSYALDLAEDLALVQTAENRLASFKRDDAVTSEDLHTWNRGRRKKK